MASLTIAAPPRRPRAHASSVSGSAPSLVTSTSMSSMAADPQGPRAGELRAGRPAAPPGRRGDHGALDRHLDPRGVQDLPVGADPARAEEEPVGADLAERVLGEDADQGAGRCVAPARRAPPARPGRRRGARRRRPGSLVITVTGRPRSWRASMQRRGADVQQHARRRRARSAPPAAATASLSATSRAGHLARRAAPGRRPPVRRLRARRRGPGSARPRGPAAAGRGGSWPR